MMTPIQFTAEDWERLTHNWHAWWVGDLERPLILIEGRTSLPDGTLPTAPRIAAAYPLELPVDTVLDAYEAVLATTRWYGDAFPKWWPNCGAGIVAGFLGATVRPAPETETVWFEALPPQPLSELRLHLNPANPWWQRVQALTRRAAERWGEQVCVGYTDLGGNLDILAALHTTTQLLVELYDAPEEVARLTRELTALWLEYFRQLEQLLAPAQRGRTPWAAIWAPAPCYMLQSDFAYMISPKMFERYVLPDLAACCDAIPYPFYHLDGKGQLRHLDLLLALPQLRGIQWIPGDGAPPPEEWLPVLKKIRDAGKLCQLYVSPTGAQTIVRELGGQGFALFIQQEMTAAEATDFLATLSIKI